MLKKLFRLSIVMVFVFALAFSFSSTMVTAEAGGGNCNCITMCVCNPAGGIYRAGSCNYMLCTPQCLMWACE